MPVGECACWDISNIRIFVNTHIFPSATIPQNFLVDPSGPGGNIADGNPGGAGVHLAYNSELKWTVLLQISTWYLIYLLRGLFVYTDGGTRGFNLASTTAAVPIVSTTAAEGSLSWCCSHQH